MVAEGGGAAEKKDEMAAVVAEDGKKKKKSGLFQRLFPWKRESGKAADPDHDGLLIDRNFPDKDNRELIDVDKQPPLAKRWKLLEKIGSGSFGQIYKATDLETKKKVAVKTENRKQKRRSLKMDVTVVFKMDGARHFVSFYGAGKEPSFQYLVMEILGVNLSDTRKASPLKKFSLNTGLRLGIQAIEAIESLHKGGFVHRDIKPSNFAMGLPPKHRLLYVIDFGLSSTYKDEKTGLFADHKRRPGFKGTVKYASVNAHKGLCLGRQDDMWMIWYSLLEMLRGDLPWRMLKEREDVMRMKEKANQNPLYLLHPHFPKDLVAFPCIFSQLGFRDSPDYTAAIRSLSTALISIGASDTDPYDWEESAFQTLHKEDAQHRAHLANHCSANQRTKSDKIQRRSASGLSSGAHNSGLSAGRHGTRR